MQQVRRLRVSRPPFDSSPGQLVCLTGALCADWVAIFALSPISLRPLLCSSATLLPPLLLHAGGSTCGEKLSLAGPIKTHAHTGAAINCKPRAGA